MLSTLVSCVTTPPATIKTLQANDYAGYWVRYKNMFGAKSDHTVQDYLHISCDGDIKYSIDEPHALFFKTDSDDGTILDIKDDKVFLKNWLRIEHSYFISKPTKEANGCYAVRFKGKEFKTFYPYDCSKPQKTFTEAVNETYLHLKNGDYVFCD
jgi:hypothetical protein